MRTVKFLILIQLLLSVTLSYSENIENKTFDYIKDNISTYKNREITMKLRLKYYDDIFEKIVFYNSYKKRNHDIEFDLSSKEKKKSLKNAMINLHRGMLYNVTFVVTGVGTLGRILGEIIMFRPVIIDKLP